MSFPRIPVNHPLTEAARYANAYAEEHGMEKTVDWSGMDITVGELAYLAEQRAYRAIAAASGLSLGTSGDHGTYGLDDLVIAAIKKTPLWNDMGPLLMSCYMDGMMIGWVGRGLKDDTQTL